nr:MAG TPA: hypothetical protein [Bacteriophage sp.]
MGSFSHYRMFYFRLQQGQTNGIIFMRPFSIQLTLPNYCALCMRSKYTYLAVPTCYIGL